MTHEFTKSEKRKIRELGGLAWDRLLKAELSKIGQAIAQMENDEMNPHDVNEMVHKFHKGISRDLFTRFSDSLPWIGVCRARYDGILTEEEFANASDNIRVGYESFVKAFEYINGINQPEESTLDSSETK